MNLACRNMLALAALVVVPCGCSQAPDRQQGTGSKEAPDASQPFRTLNAVLADGDVSLTSIRGNGNSSGIALTANLLNTTNDTLRLRTRLVPSIYLRTATQSAQNMLATRVYGADGRYLIVDQVAVIEVPPGTTMPIVLNAYCVDFEKDNPTAADSFHSRRNALVVGTACKRCCQLRGVQGQQRDRNGPGAGRPVAGPRRRSRRNPC